MSAFVLFDCSFLSYGCRRFRFSCVGNNLLLGLNESVCFESDVEEDE